MTHQPAVPRKFSLRPSSITPPDERAAFLDQACAGDAELRRRVEALLAAHERPESLLDRPAAELTPHDRSRATGRRRWPRAPARSLARTRSSSRSARGAWASFIWPNRPSRVRRKVALKVIKPGMDSAQVLARFEAERQALALMDHPNIARVLDAGATAAGRPYFVMERVDGVPITALLRRAPAHPASGWSCSSPSARPCSTRTRRGSSTATSSPRTCWSPMSTAGRCPRSSTSGSPRRSTGR